MKSLIIYAHPNPMSFCAAIKATLVEELERLGHEVGVRDLYRMGFDPVLTLGEMVRHVADERRSAALVANERSRELVDAEPEEICSEQREIATADYLFFVYPTWWIGMPAILKGYVDRVFTRGFAFEATKDGWRGLLTGKRAIVLQTLGEHDHVLDDRDLVSAMRTAVDVGTLEFCSTEVVAHKFFSAVPLVSDDARREMLQEVRDLLTRTAATTRGQVNASATAQ